MTVAQTQINIYNRNEKTLNIKAEFQKRLLYDNLERPKDEFINLF